MTFLRNHVGPMVSVDFFTVASPIAIASFVCFCSAGRRSSTRSAFQHHRTSHSPLGTAQQIVEAFPDNTAPRYLIRDRDGVYGHQFVARVEALGISEVPDIGQK